jgi:hypothetical protein
VSVRVDVGAGVGWMDGLSLHFLASTQTRTRSHIYILDAFDFLNFYLRHFYFPRYSGDSV